MGRRTSQYCFTYFYGLLDFLCDQVNFLCGLFEILCGQPNFMYGQLLNFYIWSR